MGVVNMVLGCFDSEFSILCRKWPKLILNLSILIGPLGKEVIMHVIPQFLK
jgi:hypothetical protein